jgi:hypothetical protein
VAGDHQSTNLVGLETVIFQIEILVLINIIPLDQSDVASAT